MVHLLSRGFSLNISLVVGGILFGVLLIYVVCVWVVLCKGRFIREWSVSFLRVHRFWWVWCGAFVSRCFLCGVMFWLLGFSLGCGLMVLYVAGVE